MRIGNTLALVMVCIMRHTFGMPSSLNERSNQGVDEPNIIAAAQYAVSELKQLSDSGIYESLSLSRIVSASTALGVFHNNTFLQLELSSGYFKTGLPQATFDVMVMESLDDGGNSFAIDEFPEMSDDAVEQFWIQKVERHREAREDAFKAMEMDALNLERLREPLTDNKKIESLGPDELLTILSQDDNEMRIQEAIRVIDQRWESGKKDIFHQLVGATTSHIFEVANNPLEPELRRSTAEEILRGRASSVQREEDA